MENKTHDGPFRRNLRNEDNYYDEEPNWKDGMTIIVQQHFQTVSELTHLLIRGIDQGKILG